MRPSSIVRLGTLCALRRLCDRLALEHLDGLDDGLAILLNERPRLVVRDYIEGVLVFEVLAVPAAALPRILAFVLTCAEVSDREGPDSEDVAEVDVVFRYHLAGLRPVPAVRVAARLLEQTLELAQLLDRRVVLPTPVHLLELGDEAVEAPIVPRRGEVEERHQRCAPIRLAEKRLNVPRKRVQLTDNRFQFLGGVHCEQRLEKHLDTGHLYSP